MTQEIALVYIILGITIALFISDRLRMDVIALLVMLSLAWSGLLEPREAFSGFSSSAVIAIMAVTILGYGMDRSGAMNRVVQPVLRLAGTNESRLVALTSLAAGLLSSFMLTIGSAALFLPALLRISRRTDTPASRLLMPVGFAAILGGALTMVGSNPLIILNDLLRQGGQPTFQLFSVTPIGAVLLACGIVYFVVFGRWALPTRAKQDDRVSPQQALIETWLLPSTVYEYTIPADSPLVGKTREEAALCGDYDIHLLALAEGDDVSYAPWRYTRFAAGQALALTGEADDIQRFAQDFQLISARGRRCFQPLRSTEIAGFAEVVVLPRAPLSGKTLRDITLRKVYGVESVLLISGDEVVRKDFSDHPLRPGDGLIVHGRWENVKAMADNLNFVLVTPIEAAPGRISHPVLAALCFVGAITLTVFGFSLSLSMMTGAVAMILTSVVSIEEAYRAIEWRIVFLLAGLIPLGLAMDKTGAATYAADQVMALLQGSHPVIILVVISVLAAAFSLFMSNAAATVMLVPFAMSLGQQAGLDPRALALLVGVSAGNSFILPTHQVNALFMSPGNYRASDYLKAGGVMTVIFTIVAVSMIYAFYL